MLIIEKWHIEIICSNTKITYQYTLGIKFSKTEENCEANTYISVQEHGDGCWQIYHVDVHGAIVAAFLLDLEHLISSKTKYAITLHSPLT